jgi:hypothetical protein
MERESALVERSACEAASMPRCLSANGIVLRYFVMILFFYYIMNSRRLAVITSRSLFISMDNTQYRSRGYKFLASCCEMCCHHRKIHPVE